MNFIAGLLSSARLSRPAAETSTRAAGSGHARGPEGPPVPQRPTGDTLDGDDRRPDRAGRAGRPTFHNATGGLSARSGRVSSRLWDCPWRQVIVPAAAEVVEDLPPQRLSQQGGGGEEVWTHRGQPREAVVDGTITHSLWPQRQGTMPRPWYGRRRASGRTGMEPQPATRSRSVDPAGES